MIFVCEPDIPYDDTWDRSGDVNRKQFQQQIIDDLQRRKVRYTLLSGSVEERILKVRKAIDERVADRLWC
jgi:nicotinamide riboside kinase